MKKLMKRLCMLLVVMMVTTTVGTTATPHEVFAATTKKTTKKTETKTNPTRLNCKNKAYLQVKSPNGRTDTQMATLKLNQIYNVSLRIENYCTKEKHQNAEKVRVYIYVPSKTIKKGKTDTLFVMVKAGNADPKTYTIKLKAAQDMKLLRSAQPTLKTNKVKKGTSLPSDAFNWSKGALLAEGQAMLAKKSSYATVSFQLKPVKATSSSKKTTTTKKTTTKKTVSYW